MYAENSVVHMMSGKAVSRALRAHLLTESALTTLLIEILTERGNAVVTDFEAMFTHLFEGENDVSTTKQFFETFNSLSTSLADLKQQLSAKSQTAKLWCTYLHYINVVKRFVLAERTCNWQIHLESAADMLNLFASSGHINYAKSARLYIQRMNLLQESQP